MGANLIAMYGGHQQTRVFRLLATLLTPCLFGCQSEVLPIECESGKPATVYQPQLVVVSRFDCGFEPTADPSEYERARDAFVSRFLPAELRVYDGSVLGSIESCTKTGLRLAAQRASMDVAMIFEIDVNPSRAAPQRMRLTGEMVNTLTGEIIAIFDQESLRFSRGGTLPREREASVTASDVGTTLMNMFGEYRHARIEFESLHADYIRALVKPAERLPSYQRLRLERREDEEYSGWGAITAFRGTQSGTLDFRTTASNACIEALLDEQTDIRHRLDVNGRTFSVARGSAIVWLLLALPPLGLGLVLVTLLMTALDFEVPIAVAVCFVVYLLLLIPWEYGIVGRY